MTKNFVIALAVLAVVALIVLSPVLAWGRELPATDEAQCAAQGGCVWVRKAWVMERLEEARKAAYLQAVVACGKVL